MYITFVDDEGDLKDLLVHNSKEFKIKIEETEFLCSFMQTEFSYHDMDFQPFRPLVRKPTIELKVHAVNLNKQKLIQAKEEVRKAQKAFKDAQRKLSELQKGGK